MARQVPWSGFDDRSARTFPQASHTIPLHLAFLRYLPRVFPTVRVVARTIDRGCPCREATRGRRMTRAFSPGITSTPLLLLACQRHPDNRVGCPGHPARLSQRTRHLVTKVSTAVLRRLDPLVRRHCINGPYHRKSTWTVSDQRVRSRTCDRSRWPAHPRRACAGETLHTEP